WRDRADGDGRRYFFISDGGHHDNLGLEALLRRRCRVIFASDATWDPTYSFADFLRVVRRARRERGIRIVSVAGPDGEQDELLSLDQLRPTVPCPYSTDDAEDGKSKRRFSPQHYLVARIQYPPGADGSKPEPGYLVYVKPSLTGKEPANLIGHWAEH